ncbi:putative EF-hand domain-containing protein [Helianthus annuus]|nr:putative EF-hand domain-containing protein [Helianthus annuus]KAJ0819738.1 putative parvalbumin, EF-hand domain pair [Helianthus annuus]
MIFIYLFVSYMLIEWFVLLHDLYIFLARPLFWFIFDTPTTTCVADPPHEEAHAMKLGGFENVQGKKILGMNPKIVMERLGMFWDPNDQNESIALGDMVDLFIEDEPSLDEVKEAFSVFDKNGDGYIDANELQNVLFEMGFLQISESDCRTMIVGYSAQNDGKINFQEFLKVVEDAFL